MPLKTAFILSLMPLVFGVVSFVNSHKKHSNADSWAVGINDKKLLASWLDHEMGDTLILKRSELKSTDTLFVQRYLCGQTAENTLTELTITNFHGEKISKTISENSGLMFRSDLEIDELLHSLDTRSGSVLGVHFTILDEKDIPGDNQLICYIRFD